VCACCQYRQGTTSPGLTECPRNLSPESTQSLSQLVEAPSAACSNGSGASNVSAVRLTPSLPRRCSRVPDRTTKIRSCGGIRAL
jgi:hypothetical protein